MLAVISRLECWLSWLLRAAVVVFMAAIFVFTLGSASERYIYQTSFHAHAEIAGIALVWVTFLGFMLAYRERSNIRVDIIDSFLSSRWLVARKVGEDLIALAVFGIIMWKISRLIEVGSSQSVMGTPLSLATVYVSLLVTSAYALLLVTVRILSLLVGRDHPRETGPC